MQTKKSLGQHWLFDKGILEAMASAINLKPDDEILEVGPGLGTLTNVLLVSGAKVTAVELDQELFSRLSGTESQIVEKHKKNLSLMNEDILSFNLSQMPFGYKVCANIPYYLTSNLIRRLLEDKNPPQVMALLIQKEVAQRIVAKPGNMSVLSVAVGYYADTELKELVPAELFTPPPKVDSQIIKITPRLTPLFPDTDEKLFFKIVKAGFSEKRKKLRSSLSGGLGVSKQLVDEWLAKAGLSADARAQELELKQWHDLCLSYPVE